MENTAHSVPVSPVPTSPIRAAKRRSQLPKILLMSLGGLFVVGVLAVTSLVFVVRGIMMNNDAYAGSVAFLQEHPEVQASVGTPVKTGFMPLGTIDTTGAGGSAELVISLSGPDGEGSAVVHARKLSDQWTLDHVEWESGEQRLTLVSPPGIQVNPSLLTSR